MYDEFNPYLPPTLILPPQGGGEIVCSRCELRDIILYSSEKSKKYIVSSFQIIKMRDAR